MARTPSEPANMSIYRKHDEFALPMRTVLIYALATMDAIAAPAGVSLAPVSTSLAALTPGTVGAVLSVGRDADVFSPVERRLIELGFVHGERIEVLAQAMPGGDPFVCAWAPPRSRSAAAKSRRFGLR